MVRPGALAASGRIALAFLLAVAAVPAQAQDPLAPLPPPPAPMELRPGSVEDFFIGFRQPLWLDGDGEAARAIFDLFSTAKVDGLDPKTFDTATLRQALDDADENDEMAVRRADRLLSQALIDYVVALRTDEDASAGWDIGDPRVAPHAPSAMAILESAAASSDRAAWVAAMPWMHASYAPLRAALLAEQDAERADKLRVNLARTRLLPAATLGRYILVNAAAQRLYMVEDGQVVDSMKVVVGKADQPTPMLASMIDHADLNPYWNLPIDLVAERVAPHVVSQGLSYLDRQGYEVLDGFGDDAHPVDPATIDWKAAAAGKLELRMRQKPGSSNAMGVMKFMFPNRYGVYLHDTPNKELLAEDARLFSAGCVRLEDAPRLGRWLFGRPLEADGADPEQRVDLSDPVPVYLAYLTAVPGAGGDIAMYDDIYDRDRVRVAYR